MKRSNRQIKEPLVCEFIEILKTGNIYSLDPSISYFNCFWNSEWSIAGYIIISAVQSAAKEGGRGYTRYELVFGFQI